MAKRKRAGKNRIPKQIAALTHRRASRKNIPTAEHQSLMDEGDKSSIDIAYERRNRELDPQLVWRGKDEQNRSALTPEIT
jgi:adenine-specific DNA-methyltransferase